jgi:type II secretory pathway component PulF
MNLLIKSLFGKKKPVRAPRKSVHKPNGFITRMTKEGDRIAFSWPVREALYRHLSSQHANGVTVEAALDTFRARLQRRKKFSSDKIVADVARRRRDGSTLAKALTTWIPQDEISVISSGEMSGKLSEALNLVIEAKRRIGRVNSALKTSMVTPTIYAVAVYGMLWGIGRFVTPGLQQALPIEKAHGLVYGLYVAGDLANSLWAVLPPIVLILIIALIVKSLQKWTGKNRVIAEQFFPYSFYRDIQGYTWLMSYSALLRAGMADVDIETTSGAIISVAERTTSFDRVEDG